MFTFISLDSQSSLAGSVALVEEGFLVSLNFIALPYAHRSSQDLPTTRIYLNISNIIIY